MKGARFFKRTPTITLFIFFFAFLPHSHEKGIYSPSVALGSFPVSVGVIPNYWDRYALEYNHDSRIPMLDYIESVLGIVLLHYFNSDNHAIPPSIMLVQAGFESNWGRAKLAQNANNHFGIKARLTSRGRYLVEQDLIHLLRNHHFIFSSPAIGTFPKSDEEKWNRFELYDNVEASFLAYTVKLDTMPIYRWIWDTYEVGQVECGIDQPIEARRRGSEKRNMKYPGQPISPDDFFTDRDSIPYYVAMATGLKVSGYATSIAYHAKLTKIIQELELYKLDWWAYSVKRALQGQEACPYDMPHYDQIDHSLLNRKIAEAERLKLKWGEDIPVEEIILETEEETLTLAEWERKEMKWYYWIYQWGYRYENPGEIIRIAKEYCYNSRLRYCGESLDAMIQSEYPELAVFKPGMEDKMPACPGNDEEEIQ